MPKFESSRLNGVAVIAKIHTQTYTHTYCRTLVIPKKKFFAVIDHILTIMKLSPFSNYF